MTDEQIAALRTRAHKLLEELPAEDLRIVAAMLEELPSKALIAACDAETARGIEPVNGPKLRRTASPRLWVARAELLGAVRAWATYLAPHELGLALLSASYRRLGK